MNISQDELAIGIAVAYIILYGLIAFGLIVHTAINNPTISRFNTSIGPVMLIRICATMAMWIVVWMLLSIFWGLAAIAGAYYLSWTLMRRFASDYSVLRPFYWIHGVLMGRLEEPNSRVIVLPEGYTLSLVADTPTPNSKKIK